MPSTMIHLAVAYEYMPDAPAEFWVGNIAPDCFEDYEKREHFHLRDTPDMKQALVQFAKSIEHGDLFAEGMLLHLFVDWKWGETMFKQYHAAHNTDDWFHGYHEEIGLLSARLYHGNISWSKKVWDEILDCDISKYTKTDEISPAYEWSLANSCNDYHLANPTTQPQFYSIDAVEAFIAKTVKDYETWTSSAT